MKLYCMCHEKNDKPESQAFLAPNLYTPYSEKTDFRGVVLQEPMEVKKVGVEQFLLQTKKKRNDWTDNAHISQVDIPRRHYPNVDMYECKNCGAKICRE